MMTLALDLLCLKHLRGQEVPGRRKQTFSTKSNFLWRAREGAQPRGPYSAGGLSLNVDLESFISGSILRGACCSQVEK